MTELRKKYTLGLDAYDNIVQMPLSQDGSVIVKDVTVERIAQAKSFRAEKVPHINLDFTDYKDFLIQTPAIGTGSPFTQIHLVTNVIGTSETQYQVYLEPTITDNGSTIGVRSKNPHYQFIGAPESTFQVWENPIYSSSGPLIRDEIFGYGTRLGGTNQYRDKTILSPDQKLLLRVVSKANGNHIGFRLDIDEIDIEDPTF